MVGGHRLRPRRRHRGRGGRRARRSPDLDRRRATGGDRRGSIGGASADGLVHRRRIHDARRWANLCGGAGLSIARIPRDRGDPNEWTGRLAPQFVVALDRRGYRISLDAISLPHPGGCPEGEPRTRITRGRDPFSVMVPAPLDAVVPSSVLRNGIEPERFVSGDLLGRPTLGFIVTAAQAGSLLDAYFEVGNWREVHPTDPVAIWLDRDSFIPLRVAVSPGGSTDRALWAARRGYVDEPGTPYLVVEYVAVDLTGEVAITGPGGEGAEVDAGFRSDPNLVPPADPGLPLVVAGTVRGRVTTTVWAWSDGRAWIRLDLTEEWAGPGLFGNDGSAVREIGGPGGPVFASGGGDKVYVHGDGFDALITGSVASAALEELASKLPGVRLSLPADWPEAPAELEATARAWLPSGLAEYSEPIVRASGETVQVDLFAAGGRSVRIVSRPASLLSPPLDPDARAVEVRGTTGRYSPMLGLLEWTEGETSVSIGSADASLDELLAIAASLVSPAETGS